jgi:hypothetical protein
MLKNLIGFSFDIRLFAILVAGFFAFTIIGTVSHESGHYIMARCFGFEAKINYASTSFHVNDKDWTFFKETWTQYRSQIKSDKPFPEKDRYDKIVALYKRAGIWPLAGGPLQTMLTGTIGFILLMVLRKRFFTAERLSFGLWLVIFIALFWLRQTTNFFVDLSTFLIFGFRGRHGDEFGLARYFHLPSWSILIVTALIGLVVLVAVIFKFVPKKQRLTFMASGIAGGVAGYVFWLVLIGKLIMP